LLKILAGLGKNQKTRKGLNIKRTIFDEVLKCRGSIREARILCRATRVDRSLTCRHAAVGDRIGWQRITHLGFRSAIGLPAG
jgi:hypothetical protein